MKGCLFIILVYAIASFFLLIEPIGKLKLINICDTGVLAVLFMLPIMGVAFIYFIIHNGIAFCMLCAISAKVNERIIYVASFILTFIILAFVFQLDGDGSSEYTYYDYIMDRIP